jgi:hypothetical protein
MHVHQLQFVGLTDDRLGLVLADESDDEDRRFVVPADDALLAVLEDLRRARPTETGDRPSPPVAAPSRGPRAYAGTRPVFRGGRPSVGTLSPRQIQARLRTGRTVSEVAEEAGADDAWVERFAAPIRAEQDAAVKRASEMTLPPRRRGPSLGPLGESVRRNLQAKGIAFDRDDPTVGWSAFQQDGRQWVVRFTYRQRGRTIEADWLADLQAGSITALNRPATALGYLGPPSAAGPDAAEPSATGPDAAEAPATETDGRARPAPRPRPARVRGGPVPQSDAGAEPAVAARAVGARAVGERNGAEGTAGDEVDEGGARPPDLDFTIEPDLDEDVDLDEDIDIDALTELDLDRDSGLGAGTEPAGDPENAGVALGDPAQGGDLSADGGRPQRQPAESPESQPLF